jgi:hypothetical protein
MALAESRVKGLIVPSRTLSIHPDSVQPALATPFGTTDQALSIDQAAPERAKEMP